MGGMGNRTIAEQLAVLEARRDKLETALDKASTGVTSMSAEGMSVSRSRPDEIRAELTRTEKSIQRLYRGGRGMPVDMSQAASGSDSSDPYRSGTEVLL